MRRRRWWCRHMERRGQEKRRRGAHRRSICRSEEHTSELQSRQYLVCRLLLEKKKNRTKFRLPGAPFTKTLMRRFVSAEFSLSGGLRSRRKQKEDKKQPHGKGRDETVKLLRA